MKKTVRLVVVGLLAFGLAPAKKQRDWQTGTLEETVSSKGTTSGASVVVMGAPGPSYGNPYAGAAASQASAAAAVAASQPHTLFVRGYRIEGNGYRFMVSCDIRRGRVPNLTVHGPVKYALADGTFYLLDEDGREFKATVLEKALLPAPAASKP